MLMTYLNIGLVVIAVLVVAGLIGYARPRRSRDSQSLYTEGLDNLLRGNLQKSYQSFKKVIDADTNHIPTYLKRAVSWLPVARTALRKSRIPG